MRLFEDYRALVDERIHQLFEDDHPAIKEISLYHISEGKRVRAVLGILVCQTLGGSLEDALPYALTVELLHNVSLIYDDMIDEDSSRRGKKTLHLKYGPKNALIAANYITYKAFEVFSERVTPKALKELSRAARMTSFGEKLDIDFSRMREEDYLEVCKAKTSHQFLVASSLGAMAVTEDEKILEKVRSFGQNFGIAFQIQDDVLNILGKKLVVGKSIGSDVLMRRPNYVLVKAFELYGDELYEGNVLEMVRESEAPDLARFEAKKYIKKAKEAIGDFPDSKYKRELFKISDFMIARDR
ncbi:MAG: polyprenyl synthetase family protein [Candidatus Methanofastidiosia archaeon]